MTNADSEVELIGILDSLFDFVRCRPLSGEERLSLARHLGLLAAVVFDRLAPDERTKLLMLAPGLGSAPEAAPISDAEVLLVVLRGYLHARRAGGASGDDGLSDDPHPAELDAGDVERVELPASLVAGRRLRHSGGIARFNDRERTLYFPIGVEETGEEFVMLRQCEVEAAAHLILVIEGDEIYDDDEEIYLIPLDEWAHRVTPAGDPFG